MFWPFSRKKKAPSQPPASASTSSSAQPRTGYQPVARIVRRPEGSDIVERRIAPRIAVSLPLKLRVGSAAEAVGGESVNISKSGVFIAVDPPPPIGTAVDLELELPDHRLLLHAQGKVVRHAADGERPGCGVHFTEVSYEAQELLERIVAEDEGKDGA